MEASIGSTTTEMAVADEVRMFKGRTLRRGREEEEQESKLDKARAGKSKRQTHNPESLASLCLKLMAEHFAMRPLIHKLPERQIPVLTSLLPTDLDIEVASANVFDENYWKRRAMASAWKHFEIANHGMTWKQLYLERTLQDLLENYVPDEDLQEGKRKKSHTEEKGPEVTEDLILAHLRAAQDYIFQLEIGQLLSHIDLNVLFDNLPNLSRLRLTFGVKKIGMQYERSLFGMKMCDATSLSSAVKKSLTLTALRLPCNLIDDDLLRMLMTGLINNYTVTELDLSHNKITNHGVRLLSKLLGPKSVLTTLDLCDNQIHVEGGRFLGRALKRNNSLLDLNLRLNRLTDEGGRLLFEGLQHNKTLAQLNVSSNSLGSSSTKALVHALGLGLDSLGSINLACNELEESDGAALVDALKRGCRLVSLDVRKNNLRESEHTLADIVKRSELHARRNEQDDLEYAI